MIPAARRFAGGVAHRRGGVAGFRRPQGTLRRGGPRRSTAATGRRSGRFGALVWSSLLLGLATAWLTWAAGLVFWVGAPTVAGWRPYVVLTNSMRPVLAPGDVVLISHDAAATQRPLTKGDVALMADAARSEGTRLHRYVRTEDDGRVVTKGDANRDEDAPTAASSVLGRARLIVPSVGTPLIWLRHGAFVPLGLLVVLTWTALVVMLRPGRDDDPGDGSGDPTEEASTGEASGDAESTDEESTEEASGDGASGDEPDQPRHRTTPVAAAPRWSAFAAALVRSGEPSGPRRARHRCGRRFGRGPGVRQRRRAAWVLPGAAFSTLALVLVIVVRPAAPSFATSWTKVTSNGPSTFNAYAWKSYGTTVTSDPQALYWWRLAEPSGTTYAGAMPGAVNQVNGNYRNGHGSSVASPITGAGLTAATLSGSSAQCVDVADIGDFAGTGSAGSFSVELWFRQNWQDATDMRLVTKNGGSQGGWEIAVNGTGHGANSNTIYFLRGDGTSSNVTGSGTAVSTGTWYHAVATYDGVTDVMSFYLDGAFKGSTSSTFALNNTTQTLQFGCLGTGGYLTGDLAEVSLYNVALSPRQVLSHYYASKANGSP